MSFDEVSMERSKGFVKALQELKNLRPQLYSAANYCEKSYLHNEQKQMWQLSFDFGRPSYGDYFSTTKGKSSQSYQRAKYWFKLRSRCSLYCFQRVLDNLKDYAVRALVNAVDHLGTVAYKLTDIYDQQTTDMSNVELKISCLNQRMLTCQSYIEKEGLRQQQISGTALRHHRHYILPNFVGQKMQITQLDTGQHIQEQPHPHPPGTPASKTLSWHLAAEENSSSNRELNPSLDTPVSKAFKMTTEVFHLLEAEAVVTPFSRQFQSTSGAITVNPFGMRDSPMVPKPFSVFRSFENPKRKESSQHPARSKSVLSVFFPKPKPKPLKQKTAYVS